jgi:hypothetical protein
LAAHAAEHSASDSAAALSSQTAVHSSVLIPPGNGQEIPSEPFYREIFLQGLPVTNHVVRSWDGISSSLDIAAYWIDLKEVLLLAKVFGDSDMQHLAIQ